mmetsp:Transcript_10739/g.30419  ORF Transcript_10739/g.30419 Transcript_10739/m.30419 type:complete len:256 (+) Transcript_10739:299-1066(+)
MPGPQLCWRIPDAPVHLRRAALCCCGRGQWWPLGAIGCLGLGSHGLRAYLWRCSSEGSGAACPSGRERCEQCGTPLCERFSASALQHLPTVGSTHDWDVERLGPLGHPAGSAVRCGVLRLSRWRDRVGGRASGYSGWRRPRSPWGGVDLHAVEDSPACPGGRPQGLPAVWRGGRHCQLVRDKPARDGRGRARGADGAGHAREREARDPGADRVPGGGPTGRGGRGRGADCRRQHELPPAMHGSWHQHGCGHMAFS